MISSERDVASDPEVVPNAEIAFGSQAYDTIIQVGPTGTHGEVTGLLLGVPAHEQDGGLPRIVVGYALKLSLAPDGAGFLLDQQAMDELAALTASGEPAYIVGWFYADPGLAASPPHISFSTVQVLMPVDGNLFALINPATNAGACYLWDGAHYHPASVEQGEYAGAAWTGGPKGAAEALGDLLAPVASPIPTPEPSLVDATPARAGRITAPIVIGAQAAYIDDTVPVPAFLSRKYNLGVLSLTSAWPEWTRQARPTSGGVMSALRRNRAALFPGIDATSRQAAIVGVGALVSIAVGALLVLAGLYSVLSAPQNSVVPTPTVPAVVIAPSPTVTQVPIIVVAPTSTPSITPTETIPDTATPTIEPTPIVVDTYTPVPVPTDTPLPEPPPPPTIEVAPTDTLEPAPTDTVEEPTATPIEATVTPTIVPSPIPTDTPVGPPVPTQRPTPMPGIFTPTPEAPTITPMPGIFTPPPAIEPTTPTPET
jgi:hypothetical protein